MFKLHPAEKHKIIMYTEEVEVNRYQRCYLKTPQHNESILNKQSYMYSGYDTSSNNDQLPELFQCYYDHVKSKDSRYNQVVANWYQDEKDFIAYHSDCEIGMVQDAEITMISLYSTDTKKTDSIKYRLLGIVPKNGSIKSERSKVMILLRHGVVVTMCGDTQKEFKHGIESSEHAAIPRLSLSFRQFVE